MAAPIDMRDDEWMVNKARTCRKHDPSAARSWLIVARTLFPRNFSIQFEMYQLEKSSRNVRDMVRLFEDMLANFFNEPHLWTEIRAMSEALQTDATDEQSTFLREVFTSLAKDVQCRILLRVAETSTDVLQQCRLRLLIVERYTSQVPDQGTMSKSFNRSSLNEEKFRIQAMVEKLVESLLQAEHVAHATSPVNPYRRYLACSVLPLLLCGGQPKPSPRSLCRWLRKAVEFYVCFIAQKTSKGNTSLSSPSERQTVSPPGTTTSAALFDLSDASSVFPDKDDHIVDPWHQLCQLVHLVANHLQWNIGRLFQGDSLDCQWQQILTMSEALSRADPSRKDILLQEVLLCGTILLVQCVLAYMAAVDSSTASGQGLPSNHPPYAFVELFRIEPATDENTEPKSKRIKSEDGLPKIFLSGKVPAHCSTSEDVIQNFLMALNCWHLLNSPALQKEFQNLNEHWSVERWQWLSRFEIDVLMYQGYYAEVISRLQPIQSAQGSTASRHRQMSLQLACCYYSISKFTDVVDMVLYIIGTFQPSASSLIGQETGVLPQRSKGRQLCLLPLVDSEIFSYCVHLLIACLKDRAWKLTPGGELSPGYAANCAQFDMVLGHMMVLMQHDWPKYEPMMCEILNGIKKRCHFAYSLFFNYVINIDLLEEFAFLRTPEGGRVSLDILLTSPGKTGSQPRTITRGVNKGAKEDFKAAMERQITRTEENISLLLRTFILDEADIITQNLQS